MQEDKLYNNLIILLKLFKNKPYQLAKYMLENDAFKDIFLEKIINSKKINEISDKIKGHDVIEEKTHFNNVTEMKRYQQDLLQPLAFKGKEDNFENLQKKLNFQLIEALKKEDYESAARIRDYMLMLNIESSKPNI